jgi:hypothetical protein
MYIDKTFSNPDELVDFLNGAVRGKPLANTVYGLHGLTVIINDGGSDRTTTLADPTAAGLSPAAILAQIRVTNSSMAAVKLRSYGQSPQRPILVIDGQWFIVRGSGTANAILGFSASDTKVTAIAVANITHITASISGGPRYDVILNTDVTSTPLDFGGDLSAARATGWFALSGRKDVSVGAGWPTGIVGVIDFELSNHGQIGVAGAPYRDSDGDPAIPTANQPASTAANITVRGIEPEAALFIRVTWTPGVGNSGAGKYLSNDSGVVGTSATLGIA